ncbi:hypothetical protein C8R45DRAFT_1211941 [Mycena sanguinolenta]|nr:hypothetical protein C8R45DRAFT_1211941 [Mycena sanguinolenta]
MAPAEYFLRLQRGITGGSGPPTPSAIFTLTQSPAQPNTIAVIPPRRRAPRRHVLASPASCIPPYLPDCHSMHLPSTAVVC